MKKYLIFAAVAAMFASCSSENDDYIAQDNSQKIVFESPVMSMNSRAALTGKGALTGTTYDATETFRVYAVRTSTDYAAQDWSTKFMDGVEAKKVDAQTYWAPDADYYWPKNDDKITFAAYSPAALVNNTGCTTVTYGKTGLNVTGYLLNPTLSEQVDLMYAPRVYNQTKTSNAASGVDIKFYHALSLLNFKVKTNNSATSTVTLTGITINNAYDKGNFAETIADGASPYSSTPTWSEHAYQNTSNSTFNVFTGSQALDGSFKDVPTAGIANLLMIPQTLATPDPSITITWSYTNGGTSGTEETDQATVKLNDLGSITEWVYGKKYIYNITIDLDKIYFNPTVEDWKAGNGSGTEVKP